LKNQVTADGVEGVLHVDLNQNVARGWVCGVAGDVLPHCVNCGFAALRDTDPELNGSEFRFQAGCQMFGSYSACESAENAAYCDRAEASVLLPESAEGGSVKRWERAFWKTAAQCGVDQSSQSRQEVLPSFGCAARKKVAEVCRAEAIQPARGAWGHREDCRVDIFLGGGKPILVSARCEGVGRQFCGRGWVLRTKVGDHFLRGRGDRVT
jgi:hypothetical protein